MSQMFVLPSLEMLLIAGRAVALVLGLLIFAWAFRHWRRAASRDTQRVFEQLDLVRSELLIMKEVMHHSHRSDQGASNHDLRGQGRTGLGALHQGQTHLGQTNLGQTNLGQTNLGQTNLGQMSQGSGNHRFESAAPSTQRLLTTPSGTARGYEIAARMARNGADKDELIRSCGITGHEAELLVKLHGQRRAGVADLLGKQPRVAESAQENKVTGAAREAQASSPLLQAGRQAPTSQRQATTAAQRTPERGSAKAPALPQRSRLVAVG